MKLTDYEFEVLDLIAKDDYVSENEFPYEGSTYLSGISMDIRESVKKSGHSISGVISSLVKKGWVITDREDDLISMTESGYEAYVEMLKKTKEVSE